MTKQKFSLALIGSIFILLSGCIHYPTPADQYQDEDYYTKYYMMNTPLAARVIDRLSMDSELYNQPIIVKTYNGEVKLTGSVANRHLRKKAIEVVSHVPGVKRVINYMITGIRKCKFDE